jgi:hypothetical protein
MPHQIGVAKTTISAAEIFFNNGGPGVALAHVAARARLDGVLDEMHDLAAHVMLLLERLAEPAIERPLYMRPLTSRMTTMRRRMPRPPLGK